MGADSRFREDGNTKENKNSEGKQGNSKTRDEIRVRTLYAERVVISTPGGTPVATIGHDHNGENGGNLTIFDLSGRARVHLCVDESGGPTLILSDGEGRSMAAVSVDDAAAGVTLFCGGRPSVQACAPAVGSPSVILASRTGTPVLAMSTREENGTDVPRVTLADADGVRRAVMRLDGEGNPTVECCRMDGSPGAQLTVDRKGAYANLFRSIGSAAKTPCLSAEVREDDTPSIRLFDSENNPRAVASVDREGLASLSILSKDGRTVARMPETETPGGGGRVLALRKAGA